VRVNRFLGVLSLLAALSVTARGAEPRLIESTAVDVIALLPPPPAAGSLQAVAEMDVVLRAQNSRSEADATRAKSENKLTPATFQSVLGPDFTAEKYPKAYRLLEDAERDSKFFTSKAKDYFGRPRPKDVESRVHPAVNTDNDRAYPSGHATRGTLWAAILSEIAPNEKKTLVTRGQEIGWDRVLAGVHYPSDVYAGEVLGQALAQSMLKSAGFREQLQRAKREYDLQNSDANTRSTSDKSDHRSPPAKNVSQTAVNAVLSH
jgi:acid phosphatase (class A)